ncbi:hypothetical protein APX70_02848 [Pseudomonas syringae pv. maculicola]|uniref:Uncharacterized protein n=1 Tax=Pseudomonas syringae pv. maculicola TaxID=59511 RepID=A0A3M2VY24_PSEYM|nr:hypothetical protein APX70_02848 [Pseudomonas syringae pv. maculicola]
MRKYVQSLRKAMSQIRRECFTGLPKRLVTQSGHAQSFIQRRRLQNQMRCGRFGSVCRPSEQFLLTSDEGLFFTALDQIHP